MAMGYAEYFDAKNKIKGQISHIDSLISQLNGRTVPVESLGAMLSAKSQALIALATLESGYNSKNQ